ncbi:CHAT domain-containing protein [Pedobacter africanus]|uniref:CHAT domain-containing protein n=1 Tax=Pedobacter africanus TaxID=151894 RepID=UPI0013564F97|nr:CHAT domain-containing protein [Pedobacter africanus]
MPDSLVVKKVNAIHGDLSYSPAKKISLFKQLQERLFRSHYPKNAAYALLVHRLGDAFDKAGDPEKAVFYTREAVMVNSSGAPDTDPSFLVNSYFNLGVFYKRLHLLKEAHHYFTRCIATGSRFPDKYFIVFMAFEQQAYAWYQTGDYQEAVQAADEGLRFAAITGDQNARAALLAQRAQAAGELSHFETAEADVNMAIALLEKSGNDPVHLATCYSVYAAILSKSHKPDLAIRYYQKAFALNKANGNLEQSARDLQDMGCVYADVLRQGKQALACYAQGIELATAVGDVYQLSALYANIGVVHGYAKDYTQALKYYQKALNTLPINFNNTSLSVNPDVQQLKLVANDYFMVTILSNKGAALLQRYKQLQKREDLLLSLATFELADQSLDFMRWKQSASESKLVWRQNTREMYAHCLEVCYQLKAVDKAYYFLEKSRAVLLNDQLNQTVAESLLPEKERSKEKQLRIKAGILSGQLLVNSSKGADYARAKEKWLNAQQQWENYIAALERKYTAYYRYKYDRSVYPYAGVSSKMGKDKSTFVSYFRGQKIIYALMVSGQKQRLLKINYPDYEQQSRSLMALCASPALLNQNFTAYRKLAFRLYTNLFKSLAVPTARVVVSQDGHFIPFEVLVSDTGAAAVAYLARKHAFSYVPAFRVLMKKQQEFVASGDFLGIAPLNYASGSGLSDLRGSDLSLRKIAALFKGPLLLTGAQATKAAFLKNADKHALVQLYAHADASSYDTPDVNIQQLREPVLYLADAPVRLSEIQKLQFKHTQLVLLSACNTGIGRQASGEGVFSMARGFMAAGVPASIASLWQVDDQVTYKLTESFYAHLREGLPKDVALNTAKLDLIGDEGRMHTLPYYWAAAILVGDAAPLPPADHKNLYSWIAGSLLIAVSMLFFWLKRKK